MGRKVYRAKRPEHFFGKQKTLPESSSFALHMCPWLVAEYGSREAAVEVLKERVDHHVRRAQQAVKEKGWTSWREARAEAVTVQTGEVV